MANDNHASFAKIGFVVFIGVIAIVATLIYLGGISHGDDAVMVETYYDKPVSGLSVGSVVNFRGVKIGEVRDIGFVGDHYDVKGADNSRIYILMAINPKYLKLDRHEIDSLATIIEKYVTHLGLRATVTASGITGLSRIECDFDPADNTAPVPISWTPRNAYIPPKMSLLDNFSDSATKVMNQINSMDVNAVWSNINHTVEALARTTDGLRLMVETRQDDFEKITENISAITTSAKELAAEVRRNPSLLIRERVVRPLEETE